MRLPNVLQPVVWLLLALGAGACAEPKVSLATGPREYVPSDYPQILKRWTRDESLVVVSRIRQKQTSAVRYRIGHRRRLTPYYPE